MADPYETKLSGDEEKRFQVWKQKYAPKDSGFDYDLRGAFKSGLTPDPKTGHWPDTYKKPNHPTFSVESIYAKQRPELAGRWEGDKYIKPRMADERRDLLNEVENTFYGGGNSPRPTPTPTPSPRPVSSRFNMTDRMNQALARATDIPTPAARSADPLSAALQAPTRFAGYPLYARKPPMSADNPVGGASAFEVAQPPRQIPLNQFPPTEGEHYMQNWYQDLINRYMARPDMMRVSF